MFRITLWTIRKYFADGIEAVWGTNKKTDTIIAYKWIWSTELERAIRGRNG